MSLSARREQAQGLDKDDPLAWTRSEFNIPTKAEIASAQLNHKRIPKRLTLVWSKNKADLATKPPYQNLRRAFTFAETRWAYNPKELGRESSNTSTHGLSRASKDTSSPSKTPSSQHGWTQTPGRPN